MHQSDLFKSIKFWPLFSTQGCGAFNDNVFKIALITLVLKMGESFSILGFKSDAIQAIALGLFVLPFFLFSATAGQIADKYDKAKLIRIVKLGEVAIMTLALIGFITGQIIFLIIVLFLMGAQSTMFGPVKYSILPQHIPHEQLTAANGLIEMSTFMAILLGTMLGGYLVPLPYGDVIIGLVVVGIALTGYWFSRQIPSAPPPDPELKIKFNFVVQTFKQIVYAKSNRDAFVAILGISWFWLIGAILFWAIPPLSTSVGPDSATFKGTENVSTLLLTFLSIGIGIGSVSCDKLIKGKNANHLVPIGALGLTIIGIALYFTALPIIEVASGLPEKSVTPGAFMSSWKSYLFLITLLLFGVFGGFYIVPLYVMMQERSHVEHRSRVIAVNNILNAAFMVAGMVLVLVLRTFMSIMEVLLTMSLLNLLVTGAIFLLHREFLQDLKNYFSGQKDL